jgi:autotransporter-associated beta strand protein
MLPCTPTGTGCALVLSGLTRFCCALIFFVAVHASKAAVWTWTGGGGNVNWTTGTNWNLGTGPVSAATTDLVFAGTTNPGTALIPLNQNIANPFQLNNLTFASGSGSFFLGGNPLAFTGSARTITQNSSSAQSIANIIAASTNSMVTLTLAGNGLGVVTLSGPINSGSGNRDYALNKTGTSTFSLSGNNNYGGGTTISGGTLIVNSSTSLGAITGGLTLNAGTLQVATGFSTARAIFLNNAASTFQVDPSQIFTVTSAITGGGALNKTGTGTMVVSGANTYSAGTIVSAGTLRLGAAERLLNSGSLTVSGGTFDLQTYSETTGVVTLFSGSIIGSGTLTGSDYLFDSGIVSAPLGGLADVTKRTAGTVTLSGTNTYTGGTTIDGGTLVINSSANLGAITGGLTLNAGTLEIATGFTSARLITLGNSASTIQVDSGQTYTVLSSITGSGTLNKTGAGTMILSGANLYSGGTNVSGGTLQISVADRLLSSAPITVSGGSFDLQTFGQTTGVVTLTSGSITGTGSGTLNGSSYIMQSGTVSAILAGSGGLTKTTSGTVILSGANTYTGLTSIGAGILQANVNNALGTVAGGTTVSNGAALRLNSVNYSSAESLTLNGNGVSGGGALTNSGTSTFAGHIDIATNASISSGGGTLNLTGGVTKNGTTLTITGGGTVNIMTNGITGSSPNSDLVVDGTTVVLSAASTYNGPTTIQNSGTLRLGNSNVLPTSPATPLNINTNSIFDLASHSDGVASLTGDSSAIVKNSVAGSTSTFTVNPSLGISTTFSGVIAGTNGGTQGDIALQKNGAGTLILTGQNTFSGTTTVSNGTLIAAAVSGNSLGSTSNITVNSGGTLLLGSKDQINNTGTVTLNGGTLAKGDFSEGAANSVGIDTLALTASGSHLDFGIGTVGVLTFDLFISGGNTLTIDNWTGVAGLEGNASTDRLIFASDQTLNLSSFIFTGYGPGAMGLELGGGFYEVVPVVPEPGTYISGILICALVFFRHQKQLRGWVRRA